MHRVWGVAPIGRICLECSSRLLTIRNADAWDEKSSRSSRRIEGMLRRALSEPISVKGAVLA